MVQLFDLISLDAAMMLFIIMPMFLFGMHFYTAPYNRRYRNRRQILTVPLALIPFFFFTNIDIAIMSGIVLLQNGYIAWYQIDQNEFPTEYEGHVDDDDYGHHERENQNSMLDSIG